MNKRFYKVDRVINATELIILEDVGINWVSSAIKQKGQIVDNRCITISELLDLRSRVKGSTKFGVEIQKWDVNLLPLIKEKAVDFVQLFGMSSIPDELLEVKNEVQLIQGPLTVSDDDDPNWIIDTGLKKDLDLFLLDFLGDFQDSWNLLKKNENTEEFSRLDIINLSNDTPICLSTGFTKDNFTEILSDFKSIKGVSFRMESDFLRNDLHYFDLNRIIELMDSISEIV